MRVSAAAVVAMILVLDSLVVAAWPSTEEAVARAQRSDAYVPMRFVLPAALAGSCRAWSASGLKRMAPPDSGWQRAWSRQVPAVDGVIEVRERPGNTLLIMLQCPRVRGYLLDGPSRWPGRPTRWSLSPLLRRTVRGVFPSAATTGSRLAWIASVPATDGWPVCGPASFGEWECIGVPLDVGGVVVFPDSIERFFAVAASDERPSTIQRVGVSAAPWGRMLHAVGPGLDGLSDADVVALRSRRSPWRSDARRILFDRDPHVTILRLGGGSYWISGADMSPGTVLQIAGDGIAMTTLLFDGWERGPPGLPHVVRLDSPVVARGRVVTVRGNRVPGALVSVSSAVPQPERGRGTSDIEHPRWRAIAEVVTDDDGFFQVPGLGRGEYEFFALHPLQGRATVVRVIDGDPFIIRLEPPKRVVGHAVKRGVPAPNIPVRVLPVLSQFTGSGDSSELIAADVVTDEEGRFALALPTRGTLSLIVGTPASGIARRLLGPVGRLPPHTDVGVIDIPERRALFARLDGHAHCELSAVGPFGSIGVTVIAAARVGPGVSRFDLPEPGRWILNLACASREVVIVPTYADVTPDEFEGIVQLRAVFPQPIP